MIFLVVPARSTEPIEDDQDKGARGPRVSVTCPPAAGGRGAAKVLCTCFLLSGWGLEPGNLELRPGTLDLRYDRIQVVYGVAWGVGYPGLLEMKGLCHEEAVGEDQGPCGAQ